MTDWIPSRETLARPLHGGLAAALKEAIQDGRLAAGTKLPPHRELADRLGMSVHTVSKAYDLLHRQGLVDGQVGRGTFVLDPGKASRQPFLLERGDRGLIDLSISRPAYDALHVETMERALAALPKDLDYATYLACRPNVGLTRHRGVGRAWLKRCGLEAEEDHIVLTNGVCHGMSTALASVAQAGDTIVTECIAHHLIISLAAYFGLQLQGLEMDEEGILPDALEAACARQEVKVLFTVPTLANPTVSCLSEGRRRALVEIARRHDLLIIEDDAWGPIKAERPPPLSALAPERAIYLTSFTKCTLPGLRAGYLVAPPRLLPAITSRLIVLSWMATPLIVELASRWVEDGTAERLVDWQRAEMARRHAIVEREMEGFRWRGDLTALHFWLELPEGWNAGDFVQHARALGVAIAPPQPFLTQQAPPVDAVRVSLGGGQDRQALAQGLAALSDLMRRSPAPLMPSF